MTFESPKKILGFLLKPYIILIFLLAPITFWVYLEDFYPKPPAQSFYEVPKKKPIFENKKKNTATQENLTKSMDTELSKLKGDYAVIIKDLTSDVSYSRDSEKVFTSASIYKLAVMYKIFEMLESGQLQKSDSVGSYSVEKALELMITVSDNNSALALAERAGWKNIDTYLESAGVNGFKVSLETPTVNAQAVANLLDLIYRNKAVSASASKEMKELLLAQEINDRIPKYLPQDVKVAHKTGELDSVRHDAGIVFGKESDYIFVFLSQTSAPGSAIEDIAKLAKTAYDALE